MKNSIFQLLVLAVFIGTSANASAQSPSSYQEVEQAIRDFAKAADDRDVKALDKVLHENHRVLLHQAFGQPGTTVWDKAMYLDMAKQGKIGGEPRELAIVNLEVMDNVASSTVVLESSKMRFESKFLLVRADSGDWQLISDLPKITPLEAGNH